MRTLTIPMKYATDNMEHVSYPGSTNHASSDFVTSAGCILFRKSPIDPNQVQICLLHQPKDDTLKRKEKWILPKGRKDLGETVEVTAVRETYEETGFPCELMPVSMPTRAPTANMNHKDRVRVEDNITEPFVVTVRNMQDKGTKFIWWFIGRVQGNGAEKVLGTQTSTENYVSEFFDAEDALKRLTFDNDREIVQKAWDIVQHNINVDSRRIDTLFP